MEKQMKCSQCGQVFTTIPDRNSFGEVCLCNTCLQQVPNLTITSTKLKSTHLSTKQLDEAIQAIDQQLDKGHFSQEVKEGIHTYFDKYYKQRQSMDEQKEINSKLDQIIEKNTSNDSMTEDKFTELLEERNNDYNLDSILECNDLYEYDVVTVHDSHGRTDTNNLKKTLIRYSVQGWRLKTAFTNEIGSNMVGGAIVGVGIGSNSTSDEVVLIFERKIRNAKK